jgi:hypothetical protein
LRRLICLILNLTISIVFHADSQAFNDRFWISYDAQLSEQHFVMMTQITASGKIAVRPVRIPVSHNVSTIGTIFFDDQKRLHILASNGNYYRFIVEYKDLVPPSAKALRVVTTNISRYQWADVFMTDRANQNSFFSFVNAPKQECSYNGNLTGHAVESSTGRLLPNSWKISPDVPSGTCLDNSRLASKDGTVTWFSGYDLPQYRGVFYFQELNAQGRIKNKAFEIPGFFADEVQFTTVLQNGNRLMAYGSERTAPNGDDYPDDIFVRSVKLAERKLGPKYKVNSKNTFIGATQSIKIDPKGRFVLFAIYDYAADSCTLFYRPLDPQTGRPTGNPKELLRDVCGPIHLVHDPNSIQ